MDKQNKDQHSINDAKEAENMLTTESDEQQKEPELTKEQAVSYIQMKKTTFASIIAVIVVVLTFITAYATVYLDRKVMHNRFGEPNTNISVGLPKSELERFEVVYSYLKNGYVDDSVTPEQLINGAIRGMTQSLNDPYTVYLMDDETQTIDATLNGTFSGIGSELKIENGIIMISVPIEGSPSQKVGLQPNDIIRKVDGTDITGMSLQEVVNLVRGEVGTDVTLTILRQGQELDVTITREEIPIITVRGSVDKSNPTIGHVIISNFSLNTNEELEKVVTDLRNQGVTSFVFDIRYNPGGLLSQALNISNMFLENKQTIVKIEDRKGNITDYTANNKQYGTFKITEPYVLLVNEGSASASEILAGALKDSANATLIGTKTYGKGTVQTVIDITKNSELKYTNAKWLTPNNVWINEVGIEPTIEVQLPEYAYLNILDTKVEPKQGDVSVNVRNIELMLEAFQYDVLVDGYYDEQTTEAVKAYQLSHDLAVTGIVDENTATTLMTDVRELIQKNDTQYQKAIEYLTDQK